MKPSAALILFLIAVLTGCTDSPNEVGRGLLLPQDTLRIEREEFTATSDTTFTVRLALNAGRIFVGYHDSLEAVSVLQFTSVPAFASPQVVDSAVLILQRAYAYTDSTTPFGVRVYEATRTWSSSTFTWDSLAGFTGDSVGFQDVNSVAGDTAVRVWLDTALIHAWASATSGTIVLRSPANIIGMNMILGFGNTLSLGFDTRPELRIFYHDTADTTIIYHLRSPLAISVVNGGLPPHAGSMVLQSGLPSRAVVRFDSLSLPAKASITTAAILLPVDPSLTLMNYYSRDSVVVYMPRQNVYPFDSLAFGTTCSPRSGDTVYAGQKYYTADVKDIIQYWRERHFNYGLEVHTYGQYTTMDRIGLYGAGAATYRPKLIITYTVLP